MPVAACHVVIVRVRGYDAACCLHTQTIVCGSHENVHTAPPTSLHYARGRCTPQWQIWQPSPRIEPIGGTNDSAHELHAAVRSHVSVQAVSAAQLWAWGALTTLWLPCKCATVATRSNSGRSGSHRRGSSHLVAPTTMPSTRALHAHEVGALQHCTILWAGAPHCVATM